MEIQNRRRFFIWLKDGRDLPQKPKAVVSACASSRFIAFNCMNNVVPLVPFSSGGWERRDPWNEIDVWRPVARNDVLVVCLAIAGIKKLPFI